MTDQTEFGVDGAALVVMAVMSVGMMVLASFCLLRSSGYRSLGKAAPIDTSKSLDKQRRAAEAAHREFKLNLREVYDSVDKNKDGKVTRKELKDALKASDTVMKAIGVKRVTDGLKFFDAADTNHDSSLSYEEFEKAVKDLESKVDKVAEARARGMVSEEDMNVINDTFVRIDRNRDGRIDAGELAAGFKTLSEYKGHQVTETQVSHWVSKQMRHYDINKDGGISCEEFVPMCLRGPFSDILTRGK